MPAVRSTSVELSPALKAHARTAERGGWTFGRLLVVGQLALSVPLLIAFGLFVRSLANLEALDVGYSRDNLVVVKAEMGASGAASTRRLSQARGLVERLQSIPGVLGVTVSENGLFSGTDSGTDSLQVDGFQMSRREDASSSFDQVGPRYFHVLGIPLLAGREFDDRDVIGAPPVAVVNESLAAFYFGGSSPIGKSIRNGPDRYGIVGVVKDNKQRDLKGRTERRFYLPLLQTTDSIPALNFAIRAGTDPASTMPVIRRELESFDRSLRVSSVESVRVLMSQTLTGERSIARLSGLFGILALLLAAAGLYGVTSYATSRRTGEIGLRMALGADRLDVIRMVLRDALTLMAAGLAIGLPAALVTSRLTAASLVGVSAADPAIVAGALLVMLVAGVCAGIVPAMRASRVDPVRALRQD